MKIIEIYLKLVHVGRYELILRLDGALWLTIISKPLLTPPKGHGRSQKNKIIQNVKFDFSSG